MTEYYFLSLNSSRMKKTFVERLRELLWGLIYELTLRLTAFWAWYLCCRILQGNQIKSITKKAFSGLEGLEHL